MIGEREGAPEAGDHQVTLLGLMQTGLVAPLERIYDGDSTVFVHVAHRPFDTEGDPVRETRTYTFSIDELTGMETLLASGGPAGFSEKEREELLKRHRKLVRGTMRTRTTSFAMG